MVDKAKLTAGTKVVHNVAKATAAGHTVIPVAPLTVSAVQSGDGILVTWVDSRGLTQQKSVDPAELDLA